MVTRTTQRRKYKKSTFLENEVLSELQKRSAMLVASGWSNHDISLTLGVNKDTLAKWFHEKAFVAQINQVQAEFRKDAVRHLRALVVRATKELTSLAFDKKIPAKTRLDAISKIFQLTGLNAETDSMDEHVFNAMLPIEVKALVEQMKEIDYVEPPESRDFDRPSR